MLPSIWGMERSKEANRARKDTYTHTHTHIHIHTYRPSAFTLSLSLSLSLSFWQLTEGEAFNVTCPDGYRVQVCTGVRKAGGGKGVRTKGTEGGRRNGWMG
jgi:hypothetical protein